MEPNDPHGANRLLSYSFAALVNIFLGIITARLLDTFLEALRSGTMNWPHWFAFVTMIVILLHSFILFFKVSADGYYSLILTRISDKDVTALLAITLVIMGLLYLMADWFSYGTAHYVMASFALAVSWVAFDHVCIKSASISIAELGRAAPNDLKSFMETVKGWRLFDYLLAALLALLWYVFKKHLLNSATAAFSEAFLFTIICIIVDKIFGAELHLEQAQSEKAGASSVLPNAYLGIPDASGLDSAK